MVQLIRTIASTNLSMDNIEIHYEMIHCAKLYIYYLMVHHLEMLHHGGTWLPLKQSLRL